MTYKLYLVSFNYSVADAINCYETFILMATSEEQALVNGKEHLKELYGGKEYIYNHQIEEVPQDLIDLVTRLNKLTDPIE